MNCPIGKAVDNNATVNKDQAETKAPKNLSINVMQ